MGDDREDRRGGAQRWSGGEATRRWPLPGPARPSAATAGEPPVCFEPVERPVDDPAARPAFSTVRRGYDPGEVDAYVGSVAARLAAEQTERHRADIAEDQLREALSELKRARSDAGRAHAEPTAAKEEDLRGREDELRRRERELAEREREVADRLADARAEAAAITRAADAEASRRVREVLEDAAREIAADRDRVHRDVVRLTEVRRKVRAELAELHRDLGSRLGAGPDVADGGDGGDGGAPAAAGRGRAAAPEQRAASVSDTARAGVRDRAGSVRA